MESIPRLSPAAVICLALLIVVVVNGGLILALRRGGEVNMLRRVVKTAKNPWAEHDSAISELRDRVAQLEPDEPEPLEPDG
ncbi:MAG: hypothetical protein ACE5JF_00695 [Anaerolineales bacterium]